jgi:hypothetical protein
MPGKNMLCGAKYFHASVFDSNNKRIFGEEIIMENKNWATHIEFMVLLVTLLGGFYILDGKIERQSSRTDRLYEMYCDTQKEIKQIYQMNQR